MKMLAVICAALGEELYMRHAKSVLWKKLNIRKTSSLFPALTCPSQATFRTALPVSEHGMVTSGYFDRTLKEAFFWKQSAKLYEGERIWNDFRKKGGKVAQICLQQCPGLDSDFYLSPAPIHKHHGGMIQEFLSEPKELYHDICRRTGTTLNLANYWGPFTSRKSSDWVTGATVEMMKDMATSNNDSFLLTYLPNLDYEPQRRGLDSPKVAKAFAELEQMLEILYDTAQKNGFEFMLIGDYEITAVDTPIYPNRILMENGFFKVRDVKGMIYQNLHSSTAFALADHQICHIYVEAKEDIPRIKQIFEAQKGIARILETANTPDQNHPRAGELILEAEKGAWFAYKWWEKDSEAPDYATHVDIHNKPGFDPCEVFLTLWPPMGSSQDCNKVRGSHGRSDSRVVCASTFEFDNGTDTFLSVAQQMKQLLSNNNR